MSASVPFPSFLYFFARSSFYLTQDTFMSRNITSAMFDLIRRGLLLSDQIHDEFVWLFSFLYSPVSPPRLCVSSLLCLILLSKHCACFILRSLLRRTDVVFCTFGRTFCRSICLARESITVPFVYCRSYYSFLFVYGGLHPCCLCLLGVESIYWLCFLFLHSPCCSSSAVQDLGRFVYSIWLEVFPWSVNYFVILPAM